MKKIISVLLSVLMLVTTCVINPNPIVAEDTEENEKFSFTLFDTGDHFEVSLNESDNVIGKLKAEIDDINLDKYNPNSFIFFYAYYDGSENENQFSIINQEDKLSDILANGKKNIKFYAFHSRFVDSTFYCIPIEDFEDGGEPIFTNICGYNGMTQSINEMVGNEIYGAFYFDNGDQSKPVNPTFSVGSNIVIDEIDDKEEHSHIRLARFLEKTNPEQPAYFSYTDENSNTHTINIEVSREEQNFSMGFYNFEEYEEGVILNDEENILEQLTRRYKEIINREYFECGEFDKESEEFYLSTNNKNILIDEYTTLKDLKKDDAKIYVNFTKLNSNQLYCVPCNYENNIINYKTIVNNKKVIYRNINKEIGSEDMLVGFFYGDGSGDDEIRVNNPVLSDSSIGFTVSTPDYATDDYSNIRKISFSDICLGRGAFVYQNSTLNIDIHPNNDDFFDIYFENGTHQGLNVQFVKNSIGEESLFSYLTSHIIDNDYSGQEFRYFDESINDLVVINEETPKDILNTINSIQVHWNKYIGKDRLFVISEYFDGQNFVENEPQYSIELLPNNLGMFKFYYGNDNNKTQVPLNELIYDSNYFEISQDPESNGLYRIMTKSIEGHTAISYNDASLDVNVSLPYVSLYSAPERTIDSFVSNIKETSDVTLYFIWDQSDEKFVINGAFIRESKDNDGPLTNDQFSYSEYKELQNCYELHFSELPDTGFLVIEYKHENQDDIQEMSIMLGQGNNGEGSGTEERNETYEVDNVNDLIEKLNYFKDYANGTIIIKPNQQSDKFIINQDIIIDHVKPDTNHTDASDDEMQNGRNLWLKIILTCDVEITSNANLNINTNLNITKDSKVIIKSDDLSTQDHTGTQRKITKNGGGATINNYGNVLLKNILVENTDTDDSYTVGVNQSGGSLTINEYSKVSAPTGIRVGSSSNYTGIFGVGEIVGTKSYAIYAPKNDEGDRRVYNEFGIQTNKISTLNTNNIVAYIEGDEDKGSFQTREAFGTILVKNGSINIDKITSNDDCIKVEPNTDSKIYITMHQEAISANGVIIRETVNEGQSSKIQKLIINNGKYKCKDGAENSIVLANSPNNVDITSGRFNVKFIDDYKNVHSSWSDDKEEGYYTLTDSRNAIAEVSSYADLLTAIENQNKTISIKADLSYTKGQNQEITINHLTDLNLNGHTLTGYTFNFNYVQDYKGRTDSIRINNGSLISKGRPVIVTTTATNLHGVIVEDEKNNNEYVRHMDDNLNDYLFEVNGLGMLSLNDCTVNGINAIKLGLEYPDESFERNECLLGFNKTNITVSDYVIYDDSIPCISRKSGYEMFVGNTETSEVDCIFKSTNGTAFYLKYLNGTIHNSTIEAKESCVYTCAGGSVSLSINENTTLISDGPTVNAFADTTFNTYLTCKFVSNNDSVFKIQGQGTNSYIQIHDGTFIASKSEEKHVIENTNSRFDSLIQAGRFTHDMNKFNVSRGFECITVDTSNVPYAIAKKFDTKIVGEHEVKPYIYASEDFDIDGNSLSDAFGNVTEDVSLIFNGKEETTEENIKDIENAKGSDAVIDYYDLFIDLKRNVEAGPDQFTKLHKVDALQRIKIKLSEDVMQDIRDNESLNVAIYHREDDGNGHTTVKVMPMVPFEIGKNAEVECAYLSEDKQHIWIKTYTFSTFATATTTSEFLSEITVPTLVCQDETTCGYDGEAHSLTLFENVNSMPYYKLQYQYKTDENKYDDVDLCINAGEYRLIAQLVDKNNYKWVDNTPNNPDDNTNEDIVISTLTINKAVGFVTAPNAITDLVYTGQAQALITAGSSKTGTIKYSLDGTNYSEDIPTATNAGTYTVHYKVIGNGNYADVDDATINVTITKANGSVTAPTAKNLTYTGQDQELVDAGSSTTGEVQYSLDGTSYSASIPTGKDAKEYTVYYKSVGDSNHNDTVAANVKVTIAKAKVTKPTVTTTSFEFDNNAHSLDIATSDLYQITGNTQTQKGETTVTVSLNDTANYCWNDDSVEDLTFTLTVTGKVITAPTANNSTFIYNGQEQKYFANASTGYTLDNNNKTNAGTYTVKAILSDKTNTVWSSGGTDDLEFTFVIDKQKVNHPIQDNTKFVYNGIEQIYAVASSDLYTVSGNKQTNAGTYTVTVSLADTDNYEWADSKTYSFVIEQANGSGSVIIDNWTYGETASTPSPTSTTNGTTSVTYKYYDANKAELKSVPINAGTYYIKATFAETNNYKEYTTDYVSFTINKAKVNHPAEDTTTFVFTGSEQTYDIATDSKYTVSGNKQTNAGTYIVTVSLADTDNYEWADSKTYSFVIAKAEGSVTAPTAKSLTYTGVAQELLNAGSSSTGTIQYKLGVIGQYSTSIPKATNAGTYTIYYKVVGDTNHNDVVEDSVDVVIEKKKIDVPDPDTNTHTYTGDIVTYGVTSNEYYTVTNNTRKDAGSQTVSVTLKDTSNTEWNGNLGTYTLTIDKANPSYTIPAGIKIAKESKLSTVALPDCFTWNDKDTIVNESRKYEAIYTPIDTNNYNTISNIQIDVQVIAGAKVETNEGTTVNTSSIETLSAQAEEIKEIANSSGTYAGLTSEQLNKIKDAENVSVSTTVETVDPQNVKVQAVVNEIKKNVSSNAEVIGYLEIDLAIVTDTDTYPLSESKNALTFTVKIAEALVNNVESGKKREFFVLRNHNGKVDKLPALVDKFGNLTFSSNLFSTYAIVYEDVIESNSGNSSSPRYVIPKTGIK